MIHIFIARLQGRIQEFEKGVRNENKFHADLFKLILFLWFKTKIVNITFILYI